MANLYYPQLTSGALAQYPIRKTKTVRTIKNLLADGTLVLYVDPNGSQLLWQLQYTELSSSDLAAIQQHFSACSGPLQAFTFIDPTDNMLVFSSDLTAAGWQSPALMTVTPGSIDPDGGSAAFTVVNTSQSTLEISQRLDVPANYQYCFSAYARSQSTATVTLVRNGPSATEESTVSIGPNWSRVVSSGRLADPGEGFSVAIGLAAGQEVELYGPQLEAQTVPSRYRPTVATGGVYANAHWAVNELAIIAEAPNLFSTSFTIETAI